MINRSWRIRRFDEVFWLVPSGGSPPPGQGVPLAPGIATSMLATWLMGNGSSSSWLREVAAMLEGSSSFGSTRGRAEISIGNALRTGTLRAYRTRQSYGPTSPRIDDDTPKPVEGKKVVKTTWIALHVVDDREPKRPAAFLPYLVELPDGSIREGTLNKEGKARLESVPAGQCLVSFPTVDAKDWKPL